jgi:hypothetical protein
MLALALAHPAQGAAATLEMPVSQMTWALLAALGLVAVVIAALTLRRRDERDATPLEMQADTAANSEFVTVTPDDDLGAPVPSHDDAEPLPAVIRRREAPSGARLRVAAAATGSGSPPEPDAGPAVARPQDDLADQPVPLAAPAARAPVAQPFLALHHVDLSIDTLRRHIADEPRPMPAVWVMLLDLCRTHGREAAFREIAADFHSRFNVCAPTWDTYPPSRQEPGLEAYPRIVKELTLTWGTHECRRLLDRLLYDNRHGGRRGFTMNAYNDLIALRRAADAVLDTIEQDFAEESKVRDAYAQADVAGFADEPPPFRASPLVRDLESQLDADLREPLDVKSALEREHPALADALVREWGNAALAGRLCEMLARGGEGRYRLSGDAKDDLELLRRMAERMAEVNHITLAAD